MFENCLNTVPPPPSMCCEEVQVAKKKKKKYVLSTICNTNIGQHVCLLLCDLKKVFDFMDEKL